jgi:hypothetical protein
LLITCFKKADAASVAGNTTKIHMAVESCGLPIHFRITGGEVHDGKEDLSYRVAIALKFLSLAKTFSTRCLYL